MAQEITANSHAVLFSAIALADQQDIALVVEFTGIAIISFPKK